MWGWPGTNVASSQEGPWNFIPAAGEAAGPPGIPREHIGGPAASPAAGTNIALKPKRKPNSQSPHCLSEQPGTPPTKKAPEGVPSGALFIVSLTILSEQLQRQGWQLISLRQH